MTASTTYHITWKSADVEDGALSVGFSSHPDFAFLTAFDMVLIESGSQAPHRWGDVRIARERLMVADVQPGTADDLRVFLDEVVRQANARAEAERARLAERADEERGEEARREAEAKTAERSDRDQDEQLEREFRH